jgi:two-component system, NtrC family, nitrogen regulation sensor histidine kinase NtrY
MLAGAAEPARLPLAKFEMTPRRRFPAHEDSLALLALAGALPAVVPAIWFIWTRRLPLALGLAATAAVAGFWLSSAWMIRRKAAHPWRTMSAMLESVRLGDYSVRARALAGSDSMSEALAELNRLGDALRDRRLETLEVNALLSKVLEEIDVAIFAFDEQSRLRLVNPAGARLFAATARSLHDRSADELGLTPLLDSPPSAVSDQAFPGGAGRWAVRHTTFRESGHPHKLLVLSDLTRELREEELLAWQRLVRVLGHELNNSLTPIQSIAQSLDTLVREPDPPADWRDDMLEGLSVIASRSDSLARFVSSYARLARLPAPARRMFSLEPVTERIVRMFPAERLTLVSGEPVMLNADPDQIEQALINLLQNAMDAVSPTGGNVRMEWRTVQRAVEIQVEDEGTGLANPANLFVPFFTTRPGGSGVGLVLCRKIAEAHGGSITLENRASGTGCVATLRLPLG